MGYITLYQDKGKLVFYDYGHPHKGLNTYHVHEIDLSKITFEQVEQLERDSRNGWIELHSLKGFEHALTERNATSDEIDYINRMTKY